MKVTEGRAMLHPIAGTRPRGADPEQDAQLAAELLADPKERAEHLMLVDLGRNDLGRISRPGSVEVVDFMAVERYSHVMHIVSTVIGDLAEGKTAFDVRHRDLPGRHAVRRAEAARDGDHRAELSRPAAACTAASSATWTSPATPTPRSRSARC